jgi:hypothetical protein
MKNFFNKKNILVFLFTIVLPICIYCMWFLKFGILTSGDWVFFFKESQFTFLSFPYIWSSTFMGNVFLSISSYFSYLLIGVLSLIDNFALTERILFLWPSVIFASLGSYLLLNKILQNRLAAVIGSFVFLYNSYFIVLQISGHLNLMVGFSLSPIIIYCFINLLEKKTVRLSVITSLLLFLCAVYDFRVFYINFFILVSFFIYNLFLSRGLTLKGLLVSSKFILVSFIIVFSINFFWIIGLSQTKSIFSNEIFNRGLFGNGFMDIVKSFNLFHPFWNGAKIEYFVVQQIPLYFWLIPIFAFTGLILNRKNKIILFFGFISLIGIFLTKQVGEPFTSAYQWLYDNFPGFNAFRESSKFFFLIALGYSVLIGSFVDFVWRNFNKNSFHNVIRFCLIILVSALFLWNTKPILTGEIDTMFVPRHIPKDYLILKDYILNQPENYRTMWTPVESRWSIYTNHKPLINNFNMMSSNWKSLFNDINEQEKLTQDNIINTFKTSFSNTIFDISSVKYVVIPPKEMRNDDDFFVYYGGEYKPDIRNWYINQLDQIDWLEKKDINTEDLVIYENKDFKPHIFSFDTLFNIKTNQNIEDKYSFINEYLGKEFYFTFESSDFNFNKQIEIQNIFETINLDNLDSINKTITVENYFKDNSGNSTLYIRNQNLKGNIFFQNNTYVYEDSSYQIENSIPQSSFENGLWQETVGDCNNYDNNGILGMSLNTEEKSDGNQSLQLEATNHIACTSISVPVESNSTYLFGFDYQSSNSVSASYYFGFNDPEKTSLSQELPINNKNWNTFSKIINVPEEVTSADLYVYANSTDGKTNIINRYDNFSLIEIPDLSDSYYLVSDPDIILKEPKEISFELINPTKKIVRVIGATTPFYLAMSESYHSQWQLQFNNEKINGLFNSWIPFVYPDRVSDEYHYKLNDFLNGWYVDVEKYCYNNNFCIKNLDGSYDIEMVIEFFPQRWVYFGLLISAITFAGCVGYLGYESVKSIRIVLKKKHEKSD